MGSIDRIYYKYSKLTENKIFPLLLLLYPLVGVRQGLDVSDATYSLSNFQYFASMDGTWMVATFLANVTGFLLMHLPFGDTLIGINCYTVLIQSVTAVAAYRILKRRIPAPLVFLGEGIALGLCWCPSTILYNYLTYLLMTAGVLLLYEGVLKSNAGNQENETLSGGSRREIGARRYYIMAGICLGVNVAVRMPNVVQAAFIVAVWYGAFLYGGQEKWRRALRDTLWCMLGYAAGFGVPLGVICLRYGAGAYPSMVRTMFAMTEKATDYKPTSMLTGMFGDYVTGAFWLLFAGLCMAGGWVLFAVQRRFFAKVPLLAVLCRIFYAAVFLVLLRLYWGRGVFTFQYYRYSSMYYPAVLFLIAAILLAVLSLCRKGVPAACKIMAVLVLVLILVTPLGSNNDLYPIINNLFLAAPFALWTGYLAGRKQPDGILWKVPFAMLIAFVLVQSVGFHFLFAFQDGVEGEKRDTVVTVPAKAAGVYTNADNAAWLAELAVYTEEAGLTGRPALFYKDLSGLGYLLDMPSALSTFWPDLDSYLMTEYERDLQQMEEPPVVIVAAPVGAYLNEDADGMNWFGVEQEKFDADEKLQSLKRYLCEYEYQETFGNGRYVVYLQGGGTESGEKKGIG